MNFSSGYLSLIGIVLLALVVHSSRAIFTSEDGPFIISGNDGRIMVELGEGFGREEVHQFIDGTDWLDVIKMTNFDLGQIIYNSNQLSNVVEDGRRIDLIVQGTVVEEFSLSWMTAGKRLTLGIPLHPDRMTETDWLALPGIGDKFARRIENNRQNNGDFDDFANLIRVPGIGNKRLASWRKFFSTPER